MSRIIPISNESIECIDTILEPEERTAKEKVSWFDKKNKQGDTNLKSLAVASVVLYNFGSLMSKLKRLSKQ